MIVVPMFPVLGWLFTGGGLSMLTGYGFMTDRQREAANKLASDIAGAMYDKAVDALSTNQVQQVLGKVRRQLLGF